MAPMRNRYRHAISDPSGAFMNKRLSIPSQDYWTREEFLRARWAQYEFALKHPHKIPGFEDCEPIILNLHEDIICDVCSDAIDSPFIHLVDFGRRVVCQNCWVRKYKNEKIHHRRLKGDGSLGEYIQGGLDE